MNKKYTYLEAVEEIFKDKNKRFIDKLGYVIFFSESTNSLNIRTTTEGIVEKFIIDSYWINTKWTLLEEKKNYNVRVYRVDDNKLLSSENVIMTEKEMKTYCNSKVVWENFDINIISTIEIYDTSIQSKRPLTKVVCEELLTN